MMPLAAITDEFTPNLETALDAMLSVGMTGVELRVVGAERHRIDRRRARSRPGRGDARGCIISIVSPILKCVLDARPWTPVSAGRVRICYTIEDQPMLTARALEIAARPARGSCACFPTGAASSPPPPSSESSPRFPTWATGPPNTTSIGLENEHACNISTGADASNVGRPRHPGVQAIWDPQTRWSPADPTPTAIGDAFGTHHSRPCEGLRLRHTPTWGPVGEMGWTARAVAALAQDGYRGWISLETHWRGPNNDKFEASMICGGTCGPW